MKIAHEDWDSEKISPPPLQWGDTDTAVIDEVWHSHIESPEYEEDCRMLTGGHVIQHEPIGVPCAVARYETAYDWLVANKCIWNRHASIWPHPDDVEERLIEEGLDSSDDCCACG